MSSSRWVFLRSYLAVALLVLCSGMVLEWLLETHDAELKQISHSDLMRGSFVLAQYQLTATADEAASKQVAQSLEAELGIPVSLYPLVDFEALDEAYQKLLAGHIVTLYDDADQAIYYRRVAASSKVVALGPVANPDDKRAAWIVPLFYSLIALAVFLWTKPLRRDLEVLQDSATALGKQDFSTRVLIPSGSWLQPLGQTFNAMAQRIQWLLQFHRELTQAVSHELRTPLARMRFSLEILSTATKTKQQRHIDAMATDIEELNTLIDEMLNYAELDEDNLVAKLEPLDIGLWLDDYIADYRARDTPHPLQLEDKLSDFRVMADSRLLRRALDNLVGNAMRYANSRITIGYQMDGDQYDLWVADDGPGIAEDKHAAVLVAYSRLESDQRSVGHGFGLGLAIVKRIMDLHGGEIIIGSSAQGGAKIGLRWPK